MTFEDALESMWVGKVVARAGWNDANRIAYLASDPRFLNAPAVVQNLSPGDHVEDDWFVVGYLH